MMKLKKHIGKYLEVIFLDHAIGIDAEVIKIRAVGELLSTSKKSIILRHWQSDVDGNDETAAILISTIESFRVLK